MRDGDWEVEWTTSPDPEERGTIELATIRKKNSKQDFIGKILLVKRNSEQRQGYVLIEFKVLDGDKVQDREIFMAREMNPKKNIADLGYVETKFNKYTFSMNQSPEGIQYTLRLSLRRGSKVTSKPASGLLISMDNQLLVFKAVQLFNLGKTDFTNWVQDLSPEMAKEI
jgi:hypothetical protein